jgi:hypothetical protein
MDNKEGLLPGSKESVAFELMKMISSSESETKDREYFLKLYCLCYRAISGHKIESILKKDDW